MTIYQPWDVCRLLVDQRVCFVVSYICVPTQFFTSKWMESSYIIDNRRINTKKEIDYIDIQCMIILLKVLLYFSNTRGKSLCLWGGHQWEAWSGDQHRDSLCSSTDHLSRSICHQKSGCAFRYNNKQCVHVCYQFCCNVQLLFVF